MSLGVCSWSLLPESVADLNEKVEACGLDAVQLGLDPFLDGWDAADLRPRVLSGMMGCVGEDYSTIDAIHRTGGVVPDATWPETRERMARAAPLASGLGLSLVTLHAGFIPDDPADPAYAKVRDRLAELVDLFGTHGVAVGLETGQESADTLLRLLADLDAAGRPAGVNFDPANMLLYGSGDPTDALRKLLPHVAQVHVKDATPADAAGEWGTETPAGEGRVDWGAFFGLLGGYDGDLLIEREAGDRRAEDVRTAAALVRRHRGL